MLRTILLLGILGCMDPEQPTSVNYDPLMCCDFFPDGDEIKQCLFALTAPGYCSWIKCYYFRYDVCVPE